ncbi:hypothetical protein [Paeniglutamicibacter psychrophenolicus]|uniref:hypothetical protein n=1 Tax=Paeniglutamicibacter psychrophenolicus TaxID=257454 RepID=UPI00277F2E52|nr:hypothetical protein [Paeniglutamicibacter psychrophenolicus]MDQ0095011.1 hypothetical protein [Paeniglutamicibacter psychrophenolicus]
MVIPEKTLGEPPASVEPDNFSAFGARVLNQLSVSAWLPGAFLIVCAALLAWFRAKKVITLSGIDTYVEDNWVPLLVLALPALVMTTLITQAFAFESIRSLEGYWRRRGPASWWRSFCIWRKLRKKKALTSRFHAAQARAFHGARPTLLKRRISAAVLLAVEANVANVEPPPGISEEQLSQANDLEWWKSCKPWDSAKLLRLDQDLNEFPEDNRIMPTTLGNILRAAEDQLRNTNGDIEGFVMRHRHLVPSRVLAHHDQFRTRLDMYCTLVFVAATVAMASVPALWDLPAVDRMVVPLVLLVTSCVSYGAALSSARGYRTALRQIDNSVEDTHN